MSLNEMTTSFGQFSNSQLPSQTFECIDELQVGCRSDLPSTKSVKFYAEVW